MDDKIGKLDASGLSVIDLIAQLSDARQKIVRLEDDLERLLGAQGSLERVKSRLSKVCCPDCEVTFDANKVVQLRIDRSGVHFNE